jgi:hypothetical protein
MIIIGVLSVLFTMVVSGMISLGFFFINPDMGWAAFWISMAVQWLVMHPINKLLTLKSTRLELKKLDKLTKIGEIEAKQLTTLECAYCGEVNSLMIDVNAENIFTCNKCKSQNKVVLQFTTVRTTDPLITDLNMSKSNAYSELADILETEDESDADGQ